MEVEAGFLRGILQKLAKRRGDVTFSRKNEGGQRGGFSKKGVMPDFLLP